MLWPAAPGSALPAAAARLLAPEVLPVMPADGGLCPSEAHFAE